MKYIYDEYGYKAVFDEKTGRLIRHNNCGKDMHWKKSGPELLDVSITNFCEKGCDFCYRNSGKNGKFMDSDLFDRIVYEAKKNKIFQIALGGGNPNQHPLFIDFLKRARINGIIPSYTTNGDGMTEEIYAATKQYVGALAVSWYQPYAKPIEVINKCHEYGIIANIHFMLDADSIQDAISLLENRILDRVNAVIFLTYKPLGKRKRRILQKTDELDEFIKKAITSSRCKIGFDSCMISHLAHNRQYLNEDSVDFCEAARFSAFISEKGVMYPCSFMCENGWKGTSLLSSSLVDIWKDSNEFNKIRTILNTRQGMCSDCLDYDFCHGGCPCFSINC